MSLSIRKNFSVHRVLASVIAYLLCGCAGPEHETRRTILDAAGTITGRFDASHPIDVRDGEWLQLVLEQRGLDLELHLFDARKAEVGVFESFTGRFGEDRGLIKIVRGGRYVVRVVAPRFPKVSGTYRLKAEGLARPAVADQLFAEASSANVAVSRRTDLFLRAGEEFRRASRFREEGLAYLAALYITNETASDAHLAVRYGERSTSTLRAAHDPLLLASTLNFFAVALGEAQESGRMIAALAEARSINQAEGSEVGLAEGELFEAVLRYDGKDSPALLATLERVRNKCDSLGEISCAALAASAEAILVRDRGHYSDYKIALDLLRGALRDLDPTTDSVAYSQVSDNLAFTLRMTGDFDSAIEFHHRALEAYTHFGECSGKSRSLYGLGLSLLGIGESERAMNYYRQALERVCSGASADQAIAVAASNDLSIRSLCELTARPVRRDDADKNIAMWADWDLGNHARAQGDASTALRCHELAVNFANLDKYRLGVGLEVVRDLLDLKRRKEARDLYMTLSPSRESAGAWYQAYDKEVKGQLERADRSYEAAYSTFATAAKDHEAGCNYEGAFSAEVARASLAWEQRDRRADRFFSEADSALERVRLLSLDPTFSASLFESGRQMYESWIEIALSNTKHAASDAAAIESLVISERSRSRLLSQLSTTYRVGYEEKPARLQDAAARQSTPKCEALSRNATASELSLSASLGPRSQLFDAGSRRIVMEKIRQLQRALAGDTAIVEYFLGEKRSHAWIIRQESIRRVDLSPSGEIDRVVAEVRDVLESGQRPQEMKEHLRRAYELIVAPVVPDSDAKRLLFIPDGSLVELPFAALWDGKRYLVQRASTATLPSLFFAATQMASRDVGAPAGSAMLVGDPVYDREDARDRCGGADSRAVGYLKVMSRLPKSAREIDDIAAVFRARRLSPKVLVGCDANRDSVLRSTGSPGFQFVHFATHATADTVVPQRSAIHLSAFSKLGPLDPSTVTASDFLARTLPAELVVLSGCTTAGGKRFGGEGALGLSFSLLVGGSRNVLSTLWPVADSGSASIMPIIYGAMINGGKAPDAALQDAQIEMLSREIWRSPAHWAAYTLIGSEVRGRTR
ncbi:MAG TPA: CHAT domain-containing protein [Steroidobacteraceae bacterium]|nr:CHAT domain-containing protein [Steroidobacteraceae bacterium]